MYFDRVGQNIYHARLMFARPFIDSIDFARDGKQLCGEIPLEAMSRLSDILLNSAGTLHYTVSGLHQDDDYSLKIVLAGTCNLRCQRCLGEFSYPLDLSATLLLVSAEQLEEIESESGDAIEAKSHLDVLELIEDEVLLGIPFAPKHPEGTCDVPPSDLPSSENPFAKLAALKSNN